MAAIGYGYGSEWHLLQYLGRRRAALTALVESATGLAGLRWLDCDEYRAEGVLKIREALGLQFLDQSHPAKRDWEQRWPQSGNVHNWDAVGTAPTPQGASWVLLEAKAHVGEITSSCGATSDASRAAIGQILNETRTELGASAAGDWMQRYYQYANRIALLHFLLQRGVDAHLVFLYFTGDRMNLGAPGRVCPPNGAGWRPALEQQDSHIGLPAMAAIKGRMHKLFVPAYRANVAEQLLKEEFIRRPKGLALAGSAPTETPE